MTDSYIPRTLIVNRGQSDERTILDVEISSIKAPIVVLGDPGLGKTDLTLMLQRRFGHNRVSGGTFYRNQNIGDFKTVPPAKLIIDGLDEIASSTGVSPVDEVLKKLSQLGNPSFILSCRSADWQGSSDRYKIGTDYGIEPVALHLQPFSHEDAHRYLEGYDSKIDPNQVLRGLELQDLHDFYCNPLTLRLVAEIVAAGQGLPKGRIDLLDRATELLTSEQNPAHQGSAAANVGLSDLLDAAGAVFAHLLLSGSTGLTYRGRTNSLDGFVPIGEFQNIANAHHVYAATRTRLFQSPDENIYTPLHRVIAEYLGARWLGKQVSRGFSERRLFQALTFKGGVPTSLRGIHAWLAHFSPRLGPQCIRNDPYGVLRYGEPETLPLHDAKLLLNSLASLAAEDPYFRSEDWGRRAITGLTRPALRREIVALIKNPDRHVHLSTLILEALDGSPLAHVIAPELLGIVQSADAAYVERLNAAEALIGSKTNSDWSAIVEFLRARSGPGDKRLILEIVALTCGAGFSARTISDAILEYQRPAHHRSETPNEDGQENGEEPYVSGMVYGITSKISPALSGEVLDELASHIEKLKRPAYWRPGYELSSSIRQLIEKVTEGEELPSPERAWSWLKLTEGETGYSTEPRQPIQEWLIRNTKLRREIQRIAFRGGGADHTPWLAIVHELPTANPGLALTVADTTELLLEIAAKEALDEFDQQLWTDLVRSQLSQSGILIEIQEAASVGLKNHDLLVTRWAALMKPPKRDLRKEQEDRRADIEQRRIRKFTKHRASFWPAKQKLRLGEDIGALGQIAQAYLGRFSDLNREIDPHARVRDWLGDELAGAALAGFVAFLSRDDIPSARKIAETHAEGKEYLVEPILVCGLVELVRARSDLTSAIRLETAKAALAAWWEYSDFNSNRLGEEAQRQLEDLVFSSDNSIEDFLSSVVEPRIAAKQQHVPGLYRIAREDRFAPVIGNLALQWLTNHPEANETVQSELVQIAIEHVQSEELRKLIQKRVAEIDKIDVSLQRVWMAAAFQSDFATYKTALLSFFQADKDHVWSLRNAIYPDRDQRRVAPKQLSVAHFEFVVQVYGEHWPPVPHPTTSWGDTQPWNAAEFIRSCINAIGAEPTEEASQSLERLISSSATAAHSDQLKHVRAQQLRSRRDAEFRVPTFQEVKRILSNGLPANIDDLKAIVLDRLDLIQDYLRNGDTDAWEAFWIADRPKDENTSRDRLLDHLRANLPAEITFLPEVTMPEATRADIVAIHGKCGLPIEIKGQWHKKVWDAASVQLIQKYARDWRADDRGIYLVLWFGNASGKTLPKHPDGLQLPSSPRELQQILLEGIPAAERSRVDVFVLDVSRPKE